LRKIIFHIFHIRILLMITIHSQLSILQSSFKIETYMEQRSESNLKSDELAVFTLRCVLFAMSTVHNRLHYVINKSLLGGEISQQTHLHYKNTSISAFMCEIDNRLPECSLTFYISWIINIPFRRIFGTVNKEHVHLLLWVCTFQILHSNETFK